MELMLVFFTITLGLILLDGLSATAGRDSRLTVRDEVRPWI